MTRVLCPSSQLTAHLLSADQLKAGRGLHTSGAEVTSGEHPGRVFWKTPGRGGGTALQVTSISLTDNRWGQKVEERSRGHRGQTSAMSSWANRPRRRLVWGKMEMPQSQHKGTAMPHRGPLSPSPGFSLAQNKQASGPKGNSLVPHFPQLTLFNR